MADPYESYLKQADSLYAAGDVVKAGQIWQAILKRDPGHEASRAGLYKVKTHFDARATHDGLGGAVPEAPAPAPAPTRETLTPPTPELNTLLDAGCALYDAGLLDKAIHTWELALHQDPGNALARGYIDGAKRKQEAEHPQPEPPPPPAAPAAPAPQEDDVLDKLLRDGCTLFDMGQTEDALKKWERILAQVPDHALALAYTNDARRELGLPAFAAGEAPPSSWEEPPSAAAPAPTQDEGESRADQLVREGVQLYDMGMVEEATGKWEQALDLAPDHREAPGYLEMARRDREQASPARAPEPPKPSAPDPTEARLLAAENLLRNQKFEEAAFAFQRLMEAGSRDARVLQGYQQARAVLNAQEAAPAPAPPPPPPPPPPVDPPRALTTKAPVRGGLKLPTIPGNITFPSWLETPRNMVLVSLALILGIGGLFLFRSHQRDVALKDAVSSAKASALAPIARRSQVVVLAETAPDILHEGERALSDDPLTAYYRAQECLRLDPADAAAAQLLERARARMEAIPPAGSGQDLDKIMKGGDLETARLTAADLLRKTPDDAELKAKARTVYLALVQARAATEHFPEARALLLQGRAMYPQDRTWAARLKLLDEIQAMGKGERSNWIPLLG